MNQDEQLRAEALDRYISDHQLGQRPTSPADFPAGEAALLEELLQMAESAQPPPDFVANTARQLYAASQQRARAGRTQRQRSSERREGIPEIIERILSMNKTLTLSLVSGAALLILFLILLPSLGQEAVPAQPTEMALLPTVAPGSPAPTTPAAVVETGAPSEEPFVSPAIPTEAATATPLVLPTAPPALPPLREWMTGGYGGGGGEPPAAQVQFILDTALPESPEQVGAYLQRVPGPLTTEYMRQIAERLGLANACLYQGGAVEWPREIDFGLTEETFYYSDRSVLPSNGRWEYPPHDIPPADQAAAAAQAFLEGRDLLAFPYQSEVHDDVVSFYRLLEGKWPVLRAVAHVSVHADGRVGQVSYHDYAFDPVGEYPVLSAQEAWQTLTAGEPDSSLWYQFYPATPLNPRVWARAYTPGQGAEVFSHLRVRSPLDPDEAPIITINNLLLTGSTADLQALAQAYEALVQQTMDVEAPIHVWGTIQDAGGYLALQVEGWESSFMLDPMAGLLDAHGAPYNWSGVIQGQGAEATLLTDEFQPALSGQVLRMPDLPAGIPSGAAVYVQGGKVGDTLEWSTIQERPTDEGIMPPAQPGLIQARVEQVELVYLAPQTTLMAQAAAPEALRSLMPVWRFSGWTEAGGRFEVWVQAVTEEYLR